MIRSGFSIFVVDDANREAFEFCRKMAGLESPAGGLHALVGERGAGKTHLLYAIVDEIRNSSSRTGIAYISPSRIPDELRSLVEDPTPVDLAEQAILLVDDVDRFDEDLQVLGDIVRIFVENDHSVLFTSSVHPGRLRDLPHGLGLALQKTRAIEIGSGGTQRKIALVEQRVRQDFEETHARQAKEIADLRARLDLACADPSRSPASGEGAKSAIPVDDSISLKEDRSVREELDRATEDAKKVRSDAQGMLERADQLMVEMQESRSEFVKAQEEQQVQVAEVQKLESVFVGTGTNSVEEGETEQIEAAAAETVKATEALRVELATVAAARDSLEGEQVRIEESLVRARSERDTTKRLLETVRRELEEVRRDLEKEKRDGVKRLEEEEAHAEELRRSLRESRADFKGQIGAQRIAAEELMSLQSQLSEGTGVLERLMILFGVPAGESDESSDREPALERETPVESAPASDEAESVSGSVSSIHRADFGEQADTPLGESPALHHVEELQSRMDSYEDSYAFEDGGEEEIDSPESRDKSA